MWLIKLNNLKVYFLRQQRPEVREPRALLNLYPGLKVLKPDRDIH